MFRSIWLRVAVAVAMSVGFTAGCSNSSSSKSSTTGAKTASSGGGSSSAAVRTTASAAAAVEEPRPSGDGVVWSWRAYPTGDRSTSALLVERGAPAEVVAGQPYTSTIRVTNLTANRLEQVVVTDQLRGDLEIRGAEPKPTVAGNSYRWVFDAMGPRETRNITVNCVAKGGSVVSGCCEVTYQSTLCALTNVVQPKLTIEKSATADAISCDPILLKYRVCNTGSGAARGVVIEDALPAGLKTESGSSAVRIDVGTLRGGECRDFTVNVRADKSGSYQSAARAVAEGGMTAASGATTTRVTRPVLAIVKKGPAKTFGGRPVSYDITVTNTGDGVARDTVVEDVMPAGSTFESASQGGVAQGNRVAWRLGNVGPGESRALKLTVRAGELGLMRNTATATAYCASAVSGTADTEVAGIPAILLEVIDLDDPIEVGAPETYVITVTNQGSSPGTNIQVSCELEESVSFLSASGATAGKGSGKSVSFAPLASLPGKAQAVWRVVVKGSKEGDVRMSVRLSSDQFKRPIEETEATNFYK